MLPNLRWKAQKNYNKQVLLQKHIQFTKMCFLSIISLSAWGVWSADLQLAVGASFPLAIYDVGPGTSFQEVQEQSKMKTSTNAGEYSR